MQQFAQEHGIGGAKALSHFPLHFLTTNSWGRGRSDGYYYYHILLIND